MESKDIIIAIFGAAVGLAGILLVFVGFVYSHAETIDLAETRNRYKLAAKCGMVPFLASLVCAVSALMWMSKQSAPLFCWTLYSFYGCIGLTALYGCVTFIVYL